MTGRSVTGWVGSSPDAAVPKAVRLRIFEKFGGVCQLSKVKIQVGDEWDLDHIIPLGLGGEHAEHNLWPVLKAPHRAKTADDTRAIRKAQRIALKHAGGWPASKHKIRSRGFPPSRARKLAEDDAR